MWGIKIMHNLNVLHGLMELNWHLFITLLYVYKTTTAIEQETKKIPEWENYLDYQLQHLTKQLEYLLRMSFH